MISTRFGPFSLAELDAQLALDSKLNDTTRPATIMDHFNTLHYWPLVSKHGA